MVALYSVDRASPPAAEAKRLSPLAALRAFTRVTDSGSVTRAEPLGIGREPEERVGVTVDLVVGLALRLLEPPTLGHRGSDQSSLGRR